VRTDPWLHWAVPDPAPAGTDAAFDAAVEELAERIDLLAPVIHSLGLDEGVDQNGQLPPD
jgi:hypothetical protein